MTPERTGEGPSPEDAPDWFEAEENGDASTDPSTDEDGWFDGVAAEGWFDDPDHRPIDAGIGATDEPAEAHPGDVFDEEGGASDGTAGAAEPTGPQGAETREPRASDVTVTTDDPGTGADRGATLEKTPEAVAPSSGSDDGGTDTPGDGRETGKREDRGTTTDERTADETGEVETGETGMTAETEGADSYVHRILAWLRSVVGRFA